MIWLACWHTFTGTVDRELRGTGFKKGNNGLRNDKSGLFRVESGYIVSCPFMS